MKNLSQNHIHELILHNVVKFASPPNRAAVHGDAVFATEKEIKKYSANFPIQLLKKYKSTQTNENGYLVPYYFQDLLKYYQETPEIIQEIKNFDELSSQLVSVYQTEQEINAENFLHVSSSKLASLLYADNNSMNILDPVFWHQVVQNSITKYNKIDYFAHWLSELFENNQDIVDFQKLIHTKGFSINNLRDALKQKILINVLKKADDYSIPVVAPILSYMLLGNSASSIELSAKMLKKYDFNKTKDLYTQAYISSINDNNTKIIKDILIENNALYVSDKLVVKEEHSIMHISTLNLDFMHLRNKAHDNGIVALSLINIIIKAFNEDYHELKCDFLGDKKTLVIQAKSFDKNQTDNFNNDMIDKINCACHEIFLDEKRYASLKTNISIKIDKNDVSDFKEKFKLWKLRNELQESLPVSNTKPVRKKI